MTLQVCNHMCALIYESKCTYVCTHNNNDHNNDDESIIISYRITDNVSFKTCCQDSRRERDVSYMDGRFKKSESHSRTIGNFLKYLSTVSQ